MLLERYQAVNEMLTSSLELVPELNLTLSNNSRILDEVFKNEDGDVQLCKLPEFNVFQCTKNMDFNVQYPQNDKVGYIWTNRFYS